MLSKCWATVADVFAIVPQQTRDAQSMLFYGWADVADGGPTLKQPWLSVSCFVAYRV